MVRNKGLVVSFAVGAMCALATGTASAQGATGCKELPSYSTLRGALVQARHASNGGFNLDMWGTVVNRDGVVCAVAFTGNDRGDQWPGSRDFRTEGQHGQFVQSTEHRAFDRQSLHGRSTRRQPVWSAGKQSGECGRRLQRQPGEQRTSQRSDGRRPHWRGERVWGRSGLYNSSGELVGAIGVSGDTSCADHNIAWRTRASLGLDYVPHTAFNASGDPTHPDNIVYTSRPSLGRCPA